MTAPESLMKWIFASVVFSLVPIAVAFWISDPHLVRVIPNSQLATVTSVHASFYGILSNGGVFIVAASLAGGAVIALIGTGPAWMWAKILVAGSSVCVVIFCISFYSNVLSSVTVSAGSVGLRSLVLFPAALATGIGGVLLAEV